MSFGMAVAILLSSMGQMDEEFYQDFRGGARIHHVLSPFGPNAKRVIRRDAQGLRITLPAGRRKTGTVGVTPQFAVSGDFEITVGYEILAADKPSSGFGVGVAVWGQIGSDSPQVMNMGHLERPHTGSRIIARFVHDRTADGKQDFEEKPPAPGAEKKGRLRLVRTGSELSFQVAGGESETFDELLRVPVRTADVKPLRFSAISGNTDSGLSIRLVDLRIRAGRLPAARGPDETGGLGAWLVIFLLIVAVVGTGGLLLWKHRPWEQRGRGGSKG